jgi:copper chaperone CopZ
MIRFIIVTSVCLCLAGCGGDVPVSSDSSPAPTTRAVFQAGEDVTLHVPNMHCAVSCWPKVKKTLEEQDGVAEVILAEQAEEVNIDDPRVTLKLDGEFDSAKAIDALASAGFEDTAVEN